MLEARRLRRSRRPEQDAPPEATGGTPPDAAAGARADAFISYARRDEPFVRGVLVEALADRGKEVWLDVKDIPPAADWRDRIRRGIEAARAFVFVVSPDSVDSGPCKEELRQAEELNKPMIVVIREDVPRDRLAAALERVDWIFLRDSDPLEPGLEEVMTALESDLAWRDMHNELAVRAREWERAGRDGALLLRGRTLTEAEQWQADPEPHRESPTPEQTAFIQAGRRAAGRRTRILVGSVTTALVISLALAVYAFVQRGQAVSREHTATSLALSTASDKSRASNLGASLVLGLEAYHARPTVDARNSMLSALERARGFGLESVLCCHDGPLDSLAFSRDGKRAVAGAHDGTLLIWDVAAHRLLAHVESAHRDAVRAVAFSPDGETVASGGDDGAVGLWDARSGKSLARVTMNEDGGVGVLAFSPLGHALAVGYGGVVQLVDARSLEPIGKALDWPLGPGGAVVTGLAFSTDGKRLAGKSSASGKMGSAEIVAVWDAKTGEQIARSYEIDGASLAFRDHDRTVVAAGPDGSLESLSLADSSSTLLRSLGTGGQVSATFSPDGTLIAGELPDGKIEVWNGAGTKRLAVLNRPTGAVGSVAFGSGGTVAATGSDGTVLVWRLAGQPGLSTPLGPPTVQADYGYDPDIGIESPDAFAFSPDGKFLATVGRSGVTIRDARTGEPREQPLPVKATGVAFGADGETLVAVGDRSAVWSLGNGGRVATLPLGGTTVAVSPKGTIATAGGRGGRIAIRDPDGNDRPLGVAQVVSCLALGPDGHTLGVASQTELPRLWNLASPEQKPLILEGAGQTDCMAFSPDGHTLATAGWDGTVRLWNARTGQQLGSPLIRYAGEQEVASYYIETQVQVRPGPVAGVAFSPDGKLLASAHGTGEIRLWDVESRKLLGEVLQPDDGPMEGVAFSPDGRTLVTSGANGVVRLWQGFLWSDFADLRSQVCGLVVGSMPHADWNRFAPGLAYRSTCGG